jgi:hypothetical protein
MLAAYLLCGTIIILVLEGEVLFHELIHDPVDSLAALLLQPLELLCRLLLLLLRQVLLCLVTLRGDVVTFWVTRFFSSR